MVQCKLLPQVNDSKYPELMLRRDNKIKHELDMQFGSVSDSCDRKGTKPEGRFFLMCQMASWFWFGDLIKMLHRHLPLKFFNLIRLCISSCLKRPCVLLERIGKGC